MSTKGLFVILIAMAGNNFYTLWENDTFTITTPFNPHLPYSEGLQIVVATKLGLARAWDDPELAGRAFTLAAQACQVMDKLGMAPWFNMQNNGNWGLLPNGTLFFHIHVYGRNKTANWGKPVILPEAPGTYHNDPMPEADRTKLGTAFASALT